MKKILFSAIIIAATIGCSKKNTEVTNDGQREIRLSSSVSDLTGTGKAASKAAFNSTDAVAGLQFWLTHSTTKPSTGMYENEIITGDRVDDDNYIVFNTPQYYKESNNAYIMGFYPAPIPDNVSTEDAVYQLTDAKVDFMYTDIYDAGTDAAPLEPVMAFQHAMSQIAIVCKAEAGNHDAVKTRWGQIETIKFKAAASALIIFKFKLGFETAGSTTEDFPFVQADYTTDFAAIDIPDDANTTENAAGMFFPGTDTQTFKLLIKTANQAEREVAIDLGTGKKLEAGKKHIVTLTFNTKGIQVKTTIADWGEGAPGASEVN